MNSINRNKGEMKMFKKKLLRVKFYIMRVMLVFFVVSALIACNRTDSNDRRRGPSGSVTNPVTLKVIRELGNMTSAGSGWRNLLIEIAEAGKYVDLDLSECIMSGTEFNPDPSISTGKHLIVSITLPNDARSIAAGANIDSRAFRHFTELTSVIGTNINRIGDRAFRGDDTENPTTKLRSVTFPATAIIGDFVFAGCTNLTRFNLIGTGPLSVIEDGKILIRNGIELVAYPSASGSIVMNDIISIGQGAFSFCIDLTIVTFPAVTSIGQGAFSGCRNLTSVEFPAVTRIGNSAFANCISIANVSFPVATAIGEHTFVGCTSLTSLNIPAVTNIGVGVFNNTGTTPLTITLGNRAPSASGDWGPRFAGINETKLVTVRVPRGATGYGQSPIPTDTTTRSWGNSFRDLSHDGWGQMNRRANANIHLTIEYMQ
jgi:hypothetical protein